MNDGQYVSLVLLASISLMAIGGGKVSAMWLPLGNGSCDNKIIFVCFRYVLGGKTVLKKVARRAFDLFKQGVFIKNIIGQKVVNPLFFQKTSEYL